MSCRKFTLPTEGKQKRERAKARGENPHSRRSRMNKAILSSCSYSHTLHKDIWAAWPPFYGFLGMCVCVCVSVFFLSSVRLWPGPAMGWNKAIRDDFILARSFLSVWRAAFIATSEPPAPAQQDHTHTDTRGPPEWMITKQQQTLHNLHSLHASVPTSGRAFHIAVPKVFSSGRTIVRRGNIILGPVSVRVVGGGSMVLAAQRRQRR